MQTKQRKVVCSWFKGNLFSLQKDYLTQRETHPTLYKKRNLQANQVNQTQLRLKTLLEGNANIHAEPGWRSGYRASLEIKQTRARARNGKTAGGLRARRGSSPFPGAIIMLLNLD